MKSEIKPTYLLVRRFTHRNTLMIKKCIPELIISIVCIILFIIFNKDRTWEFFLTDEVITVNSINLGWIEIVKERYWAGHSPLYFAIIKGWSLLICYLFRVQPSDLSEFTVRLPSILAAGLAGGFFAGAAWRSWGPPAGLLFVPLWILSPIVGNHAIEARPYSFLLLALSIGVWSGSRLWQAEGSNGSGPITLWALSIVSPIIAAATIPAGIPAVIAIELSAASLLRRVVAEPFARRWKLRTLLVSFSVFIVLVAYAPAILYKSTNYWTEYYSPFSLESVGAVFGEIVLQGGIFSGYILLALSAVGLFLRRDGFLGRAAFGLALVFPILMIVLSAAKTLLVARYFLPTVPGLFLLAAGVASTRLSEFRSLFAGAAIIMISASLVIDRPYPKHLSTRRAEERLELLNKLNVNQIDGAVTHPHAGNVLDYYIQRD